MLAKTGGRGDGKASARTIWARVPALLAPAYLLLAVVAAGVTYLDRGRERDFVEEETRELTELQAALVRREFEEAAATLLFLAEQSVLEHYLDGEAPRRELEEEYLRFSRASQLYDQVRVLDRDGLEQVRVDYRGGVPRTVPEDELQSKATRYYFQATIDLQPGEVYVSTIDLNQEHGEVELPWKPVMRLATPILDSAGERRGILVLNYLGRRMLDRLRQIAERGRGWTALVDRSGYYLESPAGEEDSWGFVFDHEPSLARDFPAVWERMQREPAATLSNEDGVFGFSSVELPRTVRSAKIDTPVRLYVLSHVTKEDVHIGSTRALERLLLGLGIVALLMVGIAYRLAAAQELRVEHERALAASERRLRVLSNRLLDAQEETRKSIARDLHDELGQLATVQTIDLKRARQLVPDEETGSRIERALEINGRMLETMHQLAGRLRSSVLDDLGLESALRVAAEEVSEQVGAELEFRVEVDPSDLRERVRENIFRIAQEALTNVSRHAEAKHIEVSLRRSGDQLELRVADTGVGFDPERVQPDRLGQIGMRERAELLGGRLDVQSVPGGGTVVLATIPLIQPSA